VFSEIQDASSQMQIFFLLQCFTAYTSAATESKTVANVFQHEGRWFDEVQAYMRIKMKNEKTPITDIPFLLFIAQFGIHSIVL